MSSKKILAILFSLLTIIITYSPTIVSYTVEEIMDKELNYRPGYGGMIIGRIKNLHRFRSPEFISCQAVHVYYDIVWLPPYYPEYESGWLDSGEIVIYRPYLGIVLPHFIFIFLTDFEIPIY